MIITATNEGHPDFCASKLPMMICSNRISFPQPSNFHSTCHVFVRCVAHSALSSKNNDTKRTIIIQVRLSTEEALDSLFYATELTRVKSSQLVRYMKRLDEKLADAADRMLEVKGHITDFNHQPSQMTSHGTDIFQQMQRKLLPWCPCLAMQQICSSMEYPIRWSRHELFENDVHYWAHFQSGRVGQWLLLWSAPSTRFV